MKVAIKVLKLPHFKGSLPCYQTPLSSGVDVEACIDQEITLARGARALVPTGLSFEIPAGYEIQARPRSGWAIREGLTLINTPGTIDADFRGEVKIPVVNLGDKDIVIRSGDRIAQLVLCPVFVAEFVEVESLQSSVRGEGGFGSTGAGAGQIRQTLL